MFVALACRLLVTVLSWLALLARSPQPGWPAHRSIASSSPVLKRLYVLVFIEHGARRMHLGGGVTAHPADRRAAGVVVSSARRHRR